MDSNSGGSLLCGAWLWKDQSHTGTQFLARRWGYLPTDNNHFIHWRKFGDKIVTYAFQITMDHRVSVKIIETLARLMELKNYTQENLAMLNAQVWPILFGLLTDCYEEIWSHHHSTWVRRPETVNPQWNRPQKTPKYSDAWVASRHLLPSGISLRDGQSREAWREVVKTHICWNTFVEDFDCDRVAMVVGFIYSSKATTPKLFVVVDDDVERCY